MKLITLKYKAYRNMRIRLKQGHTHVMDSNKTIFPLILIYKTGLGSGNEHEALYRLGRPLEKTKVKTT